MTKKNIVYLSISTLVLLVALYMAASSVILAHIYERLESYGYHAPRVEGFTLYADGAVIRHVDLDENASVEDLYIGAYPWQWFKRDHERLYMKNVRINLSESGKKPIIWPFKTRDIINIETLNVTVPFLQDHIVMVGSLQKPVGSPFLLDMHTETQSDIHVDAKVEIHAKKSRIQVLDVEFHEANMHKSDITTKRAFGWLSFSWDQEWSVIGQIESGFLEYQGLAMHNSNMKVNGPLNDVDFSFAAQEQKSSQNFNIDRQEGNVVVRSYDLEDSVSWVSFDSDFMQRLKAVLDKQQAQQEEKDYLQVALNKARSQSHRILGEPDKSEPVPVKKESVPQAEDPQIDQAPVTLEPPHSQQVVEQQPVSKPISKITFNSLVQGTLLDGFYYTQSMMLVPHSCDEVSTHKDCWIARSHGGRLGYGIDGAIPKYFAHIKDIDQARLLRDALREVAIKRLTLRGKGQTADRMIVQGAVGNEPIYIELTVSDLE